MTAADIEAIAERQEQPQPADVAALLAEVARLRDALLRETIAREAAESSARVLRDRLSVSRGL